MPNLLEVVDEDMVAAAWLASTGSFQLTPPSFFEPIADVCGIETDSECYGSF
jgi:hypothetical protein